MFRPNRVGTPIIHQQSAAASTAAITASQNATSHVLQAYSVINATPILDFGRSQLSWAGTGGSYSASNKTAFVQQITITEPLAGDTVGLELNGAFLITCPASAILRPVFFAQTAALGGQLNGGTSLDSPTPLKDHWADVVNATHTNVLRYLTYKEILIAQRTGVGGAYAHGVAILDQSGAAWTIPFFQAVFSVRQLNDQQTVGYRDTLR